MMMMMMMMMMVVTINIMIMVTSMMMIHMPFVILLMFILHGVSRELRFFLLFYGAMYQVLFLNATHQVNASNHKQ